MFLGLDPQTLSYLGYSVTAIATMAAAYWTTKGGVASLELTQNDLQLMTKGVLTGALHVEKMEDILSCIDDPMKTIKDVEKSMAFFEKDDMMHISMGMNSLAISL